MERVGLEYETDPKLMTLISIQDQTPNIAQTELQTCMPLPSYCVMYLEEN